MSIYSASGRCNLKAFLLSPRQHFHLMTQISYWPSCCWVSRTAVFPFSVLRTPLQIPPGWLCGSNGNYSLSNLRREKKVENVSKWLQFISKERGHCHLYFSHINTKWETFIFTLWELVLIHLSVQSSPLWECRRGPGTWWPLLGRGLWCCWA